MTTETGIAAARRWRTLVADDSKEGGTTADLDVVFVCTGNRFRSPLAAALFVEATPGLPVTVRSAGTLELGSVSALPEALKEGRRLGVDISSHRSTCIAGKDLSQADLVIGFEHKHLEIAVMEAHVTPAHAFTLAELVALLENVKETPGPHGQVERSRSAIASADALRRRGGVHVEVLEIRDPLGEPAHVAEETAERIASLIPRLARGLFG